MQELHWAPCHQVYIPPREERSIREEGREGSYFIIGELVDHCALNGVLKRRYVVDPDEIVRHVILRDEESTKQQQDHHRCWYNDVGGHNVGHHSRHESAILIHANCKTTI